MCSLRHHVWQFTPARWAALLGVFLVSVSLAANHSLADTPVDFLQEIEPLLAEHCVECHGAETQESGLRVDTGVVLLEGGYSGAAVVANNSSESLLIKAIEGKDDDVAKMPPEGPGLNLEQIELFRRWIDQGAAVPDVSTALDSREYERPLVVPADRSC